MCVKQDSITGFVWVTALLSHNENKGGCSDVGILLFINV